MHPSQTWRQRLLERLANLQLANGASANFQHALEVEANVVRIVDGSEAVSLGPLDTVVLRSAALIHGALPSCVEAASEPGTSQACTSQMKAVELLLRDMLVYEDAQIEWVTFLVTHCEDTVRRFPTVNTCAHRLQIESSGNPVQAALKHLNVLREADAIAHLAPGSLVAAISSWLDANIEWLPGGRGPFSTIVWHESIEGNLRLTAKRAILDCFTEDGKMRALIGYSHVEDSIMRQCAQIQADYLPENFAASAYSNSLRRMKGNASQINVIEYLDEPKLLRTLRNIPLHGDPTIFPYESAKLSSVSMELTEITPIATYVLTERLQATQDLFDSFMTAYCFSLFDLVGLLRYSIENENVVHAIAPCLIETHLEEVDGYARSLNLLVDGLHRCITATRNGLMRLRVLRAQNVKYPLIARPVTWNRVLEYPHTPPESLKRIYRYTRVADMPSEVFRLTNGAVTDSNCRTFFFRDLNALGSLGQRPPNDSSQL